QPTFKPLDCLPMRNFRTFLSLLVLFLNLSCGDSYESSVDSTPPEEIGSISTEDPTAGVTRDSPEDSSLEDDTEYDQWIRSFRERMRADPYYALQNPKAFLSDPKLTSNMKKALTDEIFLMNVYMHTDEAFEFLSERIPE